MHSVKLDTQGRVIGVATGPPREGWIAAPEGERDPYGFRHDGERWHVLTEHERRQRTLDHTEERPSEHPGRARLRAAKDKLRAGRATPNEVQQLLADVADLL